MPARTPADRYTEATAALSQGDLARSEALYRSLLKAFPRNPATLHGLGMIALQRGDYDRAIGLIQQALDQSPDWADAHNSLGNCLVLLGRREAALASYRRAIAGRPDYAEAHCNLATILGLLNRHQEALPHYREALSARSDFADAHYRQGVVLLELGRLSEAIEGFRKAISLNPANPIFYRILVEQIQVTEGEPCLPAMEALAANLATLSPDEQAQLHFARAKAYADLGRIELASRHFFEGNAIKRRSLVYDEAARLRSLNGIKSAFTRERLKRNQHAGNPAAAPVFVVGMPRSGSTLVEQILASHPEVYGAGERTDLEHALRAAAGGRTPAPELLAQFTKKQSRRVAADYLRRIKTAAGSRPRIVDKTLSNFRFLGIIHLALPNARIIHIRRDPLDTCFSCFTTWFADGQAYTYELDALARYYRAYEALMTHWRTVLPAGTMLEVRYEALVADLEGEARRMIAYCGLEWDYRCLAFYRTDRVVRTSIAQVRRPLYATSVGRSHDFPSIARPLAEALQTASRATA